ncbi:MAG: sulfite exporter TauE/SafE family protein [Candidatus Jidaibacter sp.]|nr:sulfite exporter TauE/SafE family protein [Candidatus Jidaibacter sp.]
MSGCHHNDVLDLYFAGYGEIGLIITLFLNGFIGSFIHCITMCGSISISISNARLMHIKPDNMSQYSKIDSVFAAPYYLGKAITYVLLAVIFFALKSTVKDFLIAKILAFSLLVTTAIAFIVIAIGGNVNIKIVSGKYKIIERFISVFSAKYFSFFGLKGLIYGMILGLIPCGLVYTSIITAAAYAHTVYTVIVGVFAFGFATIPGLFISAYFGSIVTAYKSKKVIGVFFTLLMLFNSYLLISYALKLL